MTPAQEKKEVREFWIETTFKDDAYEPEFRHLATMAIRNNDGALFYPRGKFELYIERSAYDELLKERDAAIAERDEWKSSSEGWKHEAEQLKKDAQGLAVALRDIRFQFNTCDIEKDSFKEWLDWYVARALKFWEGREK